MCSLHPVLLYQYVPKSKERTLWIWYPPCSPLPLANHSPTRTCRALILLVPGGHLQAGSCDCLRARGWVSWSMVVMVVVVVLYLGNLT